MGVPQWLSSLFTVDDKIIKSQFSLVGGQSDTGASEGSGESPGGGQGHADDTSQQGSQQGNGAAKERKTRGEHPPGGPAGAESAHSDEEDERLDDGVLHVQRPIPLSEYVRQSEEQAAERKAASSSTLPFIPKDIDVVRERLNDSFHLPDNKDIVVREFHIGTHRSWPAIAVFVDGLASTLVINTNLLEPLMLLSHLEDREARGTASTRVGAVLEALLPSNQVSVIERWEDVVAGVLSGSTVILIDGCDAAIVAETKGWEHRSVSAPQAENVVNGPHQAFTEHFRANTGLVRSMLRSPDLVTEMMTVGKLAKTDVALMYIDGLTNKRLVEEVRRRIKAIDVDFLADTGLLQQFIEDNPRVWIPQTLTTERPDRVTHALTEGYVAIFVGQSSFALVTPMVLFGLMAAAEDAYLRFPFGSFLRIIRWIALAAALFVPALYVSITNYHPEMIPTDLMMAVAASREQVPFPVIIEILLMELAIELIREAGIRIPSIIGPTIGIVGALIIGQAAVQAGIVSPLLVITIAVTALASFTIPNYNLQFGVRIMRFVFLFISALFGFYGLTLAIIVILARLTVQQSLGVPLLSPAAPKEDSSRDAFLRGPAFEMNQRPQFLFPQQSWRQQPYTRPWSNTSDVDSVMTDQNQTSGNSGSQGGNNGQQGQSQGREQGNQSSGGEQGSRPRQTGLKKKRT